MSGTEIPADEYYELVIFPPDDWSERMVETFAERIAGELAPAVMMTLQKRKAIAGDHVTLRMWSA